MRAFAVIWAAALVSNTGTWLQQVGAGWLMTSLSPSPLMVSLVQAASLLPVFLFAPPQARWRISSIAAAYCW